MVGRATYYIINNYDFNLMKKETRIAIKGSYDLVKPDQMVKMANVLQAHIIKQKLYTTISNKNYVHVEGWQFAGSLMGLFPMVSEVKDISKTGEVKWQATVEIKNIKTGEVVGRGFAVCSNKEYKKKSFDEYAVLSMAQTRATGKAYRNLIGWVMKLAGYEGTPSEEMVNVGEKMPPANVINDVKVVEVKNKTILVCSDCDGIVGQAGADFSKRIYGKILCKECSKNHKAKK